MQNYDYKEALVSDIKDFWEDSDAWQEIEDRDELEETMNDELWAEDSITGNGSGSYFFNREEVPTTNCSWGEVSRVFPSVDGGNMYPKHLCSVCGVKPFPVLHVLPFSFQLLHSGGHTLLHHSL